MPAHSFTYAHVPPILTVTLPPPIRPYPSFDIIAPQSPGFALPCTSPVSPPPPLQLHLHLARTAAVKALTDKTNNVVGTSAGEASTSEQTSGPAEAGYSGGSDFDSDYDEEIAVWDARRTLLAGDPPPTVTAATGTG